MRSTCIGSAHVVAANLMLQLPARTTAEAEARVAVEGDTVTVHYKCMNPKGEIVETSDSNEPLTFEIGAGEIFGNKMFQASGGEWNKDLLFNVPRQHEEVQRLEGRYKNVGGLKEGLVVELTNGSNAMILDVKDDVVQLDANNMMAGQILMFELELVSIDPCTSGSTP
ncbi:MAG: peptidyl-prolyl cis-trans FKBP-type [Trebouxia sp. A1-2]|nr:MAG: peptidyl-prolyl cis-trans FKBP-type [Trebouxia sp. A1-2]